MSDAISVTCPHCGSTLQVDTEAGVVVDHSPPPRSEGERPDFDARLRQMEEDRRRASDRLEEAMRKEKSRDRLMEDRFRKLMDEAKKTDDARPPIRDIDLD